MSRSPRRVERTPLSVSAPVVRARPCRAGMPPRPLILCSGTPGPTPGVCASELPIARGVREWLGSPTLYRSVLEGAVMMVVIVSGAKTNY